LFDGQDVPKLIQGAFVISDDSTGSSPPTMPVFLMLARASAPLLAVAVCASLASGVCSVLLVATINTALAETSRKVSELALQFAALAILAMLARTLAGVLFTRLSQSTLANLRQHISRAVANASYRGVQEIGPARIQSLLTEDTGHISTFFVGIPILLMNAVTVIGCFAYLAVLSWKIFLMALVVAVLGSAVYHFSHVRVLKHLRAASRKQDELFSHFGALFHGAKELKLNRARAETFISQELGGAVETVRRHRVSGLSLYSLAASWGHFLFFAFIGLTLFLFADLASGDSRVATGYAIVFLYLMTPLEVLLNNIPVMNVARVSAQRIEEVMRKMSNAEAIAVERTPQERVTVELDAVTHSYYHEREDDIFRIGPVSLSFPPGQVTFLVGGNGSGKTTLAKLLVGLYVPEHGRVLLNGEITTDANRDAYRQQFSAVFADFHLFQALLGMSDAGLDARANRMLERLHLNHKVTVHEGAFSTRDLSQGQRKRLALLVACLEDRPFIVFDEWAADQDPVFKEVFYREIVPDLKARGKTVLVISHDDRYFPLADRLIRMEEGRIVEVSLSHSLTAKGARYGV